MASFHCYNQLVLIITLITITITLQLRSSSSASSPLSTGFYSNSCPKLLPTVRNIVEEALKKEARMGASLLRLHFHDCFVNGCDGSILLDDTSSLKGEKTARPNVNSLRGFEVIDKIKSAVEGVCSTTVSCADILAIAARDSVVKLGGPFYEVQLGRRDSKTANLAAANNNIPSPLSNLSVLLSSFKSKGLSATDLVALSGAHTIGQARCVNFKQRLYSKTNIDRKFAQRLQRNCSYTSTRKDNNLAPLDTLSPTKFDNSYYANLVSEQGLLFSDQQLLSVEGPTAEKVRKYSTRIKDFRHDFANGMINMGGINTLTGKNGEIRRDCKKVN